MRRMGCVAQRIDDEGVEPAKPLEQPKTEPVLSGADKFRWPISGRVITDFANSKGTGINIEAPEGAVVRAAENGQVIYVDPVAEVTIARFASHPVAANSALDPTSLPAYRAVAEHLLKG